MKPHAKADDRDEDDPGEQERRREVAEVQRGGREVAESGAHCKGRHDGRPIEGLPTGRVDAVDGQRLLGPLPSDEDGQQPAAYSAVETV